MCFDFMDLIVALDVVDRPGEGLLDISVVDGGPKEFFVPKNVVGHINSVLAITVDMGEVCG